MPRLLTIGMSRLRFFIPILVITITLIVGGVAYAVTLAISSVGEMQDDGTKELKRSIIQITNSLLLA